MSTRRRPTVIRFGPWSTLLSLAVGLGCTMALALALRPVRQQAGRLANRCLAALLLVVALKLVPYAIGYAGFYDAYPWLSFAPFDIGLALGPLLWLHVMALTTGRLPRRWGLHLLPAVVQLGYGLVCVAQPLAWKNSWHDRVHAPWLSPIENTLVAVSLALYLHAAWQRRRQHQRWLVDHASNADDHRHTALRNVIVAMAALLVLQAGYEIATQLWQLDYFQRFPLYLALSALLYGLGLEGWRQADRQHPVPAHADGVPNGVEAAGPPNTPEGPNAPDAPDAPDAPHAPDAPSATDAEAAAGPPDALDAPDARDAWHAPEAQHVADAADSSANPPPAVARSPDWPTLGRQWQQRLLDAGWWREPELDLDRLARLLGTNTHYLSRAFNDGLQANFAQVIAQARVADVQAQLAAPGGAQADLLQLAFAAGFSSKSSFNRTFKAATGLTPSAWRAAQVPKPENPR